VPTRQNLAENGGQDVIIFASFVTVGLVIAWHRPGNHIGRIILAGIDFQGLAIAGSLYVTLASVVDRALEPAHLSLWTDYRR
jgi:hypothetical protein